VMALSALEGGEDQAFRAFHRYFPAAPLLIDTYDSIAAAERLAKRRATEDLPLSAVRLDSGDLVSQSQQIRQLLPDVKIMASGDLDEFEIQRLRQTGTVIDAYGLGTKLVTGAPVNGVYKLVEIDGIPVMKESSDKLTYPGRKQIFRQGSGETWHDRLGLISETTAPDEYPLLQLVVKQGKRLQPDEDLVTIAERCRSGVTQLPAACRQIDQPIPLDVQISPTLQSLTQQTRRQPVSVF
jgi:nicotinate phosphoribosyltransferase